MAGRSLPRDQEWPPALERRCLWRGMEAVPEEAGHWPRQEVALDRGGKQQRKDRIKKKKGERKREVVKPQNHTQTQRINVGYS